MDKPGTLLTGPEDAGRRLDKFLAEKMSDMTRSALQKLISEGHIRIDGTVRTKSGYSLNSGQAITIDWPVPVTAKIQPQDLPLDVLFEDADLLVLNKARGMVVHPAVGNFEGTLVNALLARCNDLSGINGVIRPGIVHRLDKDTSGLMLVAKTDRAHVALASQIRDKTVSRIYLALVHGNLAKVEGTVSTNIGRHSKDRKKMAVVAAGGKPAVTHFTVIERFQRFTLVQCRLETGRTHQIRVHMAHIGHPVVADPKYGRIESCFAILGQALHSAQISFIHPADGKRMCFKAPLPADMERIIRQLR